MTSGSTAGYSSASTKRPSSSIAAMQASDTMAAMR